MSDSSLGPLQAELSEPFLRHAETAKGGMRL